MAGELRAVGAALAAVDAERNRLLARRGQLLSGLRAPAPVRAPRPVEATPVDVRNVLLSLGGVLLGIAAVAFTVISWGSLGIAGRALVLAVLTAAAMAAPLPLTRRRLTATAEVVAGLGLLLLVLDAYAVRRVLLPGTDGALYAAAASAVVAAVWAGYAALPRPRLRLTAPTALVLAQLPLPLWAFGERSSYGAAAAFLAVALADGAAATWGRRLPRALRSTAAAAGVVTGVIGLLTAGEDTARADGLGTALRVGLLLFGAAAGAVFVAYRVPAGAGASIASNDDPVVAPGGDDDSAVTPDGHGDQIIAPVRPAAPAPSAPFLLALAAGLAVMAGLGGVLRVACAGSWAVPAIAACAAALLGAAAAAWRTAARRAVVAGGAAGLALPLAVCVVWALGPLAVAACGPLGWAGAVWRGAPAGALAATQPGMTWSGPTVAVVTAAVATAVAVAAGRRRPAWAVPGACAALALGTLVAAALPAALDLPYPLAVALRVALALGLVALAATGRAVPARFALPWAIGVAVTAAAWALAERTGTCVVLAVLAAAFAAAAAARWTDPWWRAVAGPAAVGFAAALACAAPMAAGAAPYEAAFAVLAVAAAAQTAAFRGGAAPLEVAGAVAGGLAVCLALGDIAVLAAVLGLAGVLAALVALRPERRPGAGLASAALLVAAAWVRLGAAHVTVPEAYTLPLTAAALTLGVLRRRRAATVSSWSAYGPGLAVTLLPSLAATWSGGGPLRPLLLGAAALVLTLLGARHRLQAPLLLGGGVLVLDGLRELAPYVLLFLGVLPRWLPLAAAGAVLLAVGATYERRLRDARRLREALRRLS